MTKLKLELAQEAGEILTREEQKRILGGAATGSDACAGKQAWAKCLNSQDVQVGEGWSRTGCYTSSDSNPCPSGQRVSCSC